MMRLRYIIIIFLMTIIFPNYVFAAGDVSVSSRNISVVKGGTSSFSITASNSAGRIDISSSNPGVVDVSKTSIFLDMGSETIVVSGNSVGSATITVYASDVTTYDDEDLTGKSYTINVIVSEPSVNQNKNLSNNNNVKSITVEGFDLEKVSDKEFNLSVLNSVTSVNIKTVLEDKKASVSGDGIRELKIGDNIIEIIVTSESGKQNKYVLNITRKEGYHLDDLTSMMGSLTEKNINVKINADSVLSSDILDKIKDSGKLVNLNFSDENDKLLYSWIIDGNKIGETNDFLTSVSYISEYKEDIEKLTNYADGLYINIKNSSKLPGGSVIKLHVGDKYDSGEQVKLYCYNPKNNDLNFVLDGLDVKAKYVEFEVNNCSNYFVTKSNIKAVNDDSKSLNIFIIIGLVVAIIVFFIFFILLKKKKNRGSNNIGNINSSNNFVNVNSSLEEISNITEIEDVITNVNNDIVNYMEEINSSSLSVDNSNVELNDTSLNVNDNIDDYSVDEGINNTDIISGNDNIAINEETIVSDEINPLDNINNNVVNYVEKSDNIISDNIEEHNVMFGGYNIDLENDSNG